MEKNHPLLLEEIIFSSSDKKKSKQIAKLVADGRIKKIASRIYTSNLTDMPNNIIRRHLFLILAHLYPKAVLSHRSAFEFKPTATGHIFLSYKYTRKIPLAGLTIQLLDGPNSIPGDNPISGQLFVSQQARAFLENLQISKKTGAQSKTLALPDLEDKLEEIIRVNGEDALNALRDKAKEIAKTLEMEKEFSILNKLISALLSTHDGQILSSPLAIARVNGIPYDAARLELFKELFIALQTKEFKSRQDKNLSNKAFRNFAFFESYFSNYIEGTVFKIAEAKQIIETEQVLPARNEDSHDVLGTYFLVSNRNIMATTPKTAEELLIILKQRHELLLKARTDKKPGQFKDRNNYAGQTSFVDFSLVEGTLIKSFDFYRILTHPFAKAAYLMFVISEIHPFLDGNGRIARVMMNAELVAGGQSKIIIPTVFRDDYMLVLRKLTRQKDPAPYIRMLERAFEFSSYIYNDDVDEMQRQLALSNAFMEHTEGKLTLYER